MKTVQGLFPRLCDPEHLDQAARDTVRGKRRRPDVAWFLFRREEELANIREELASAAFRPSPLELVRIRDPKPRLISRVPIRDRVVHTALVALMEPVFLRSLSPDAFACRPDHGTHRAVLRLLEFQRRHRFVLHLDIKSYFPSIDRDILIRLLHRRIRDRPFLGIVEQILHSGAGLYDWPDARQAARLATDWPPPGRGLPIGSYTSQLFAAHVYLAAFDHWVKRQLKVPGYLRYVDDLFLFAHHRADLRRWREQAATWLMEERGLRLKHPNARILSCHGHLDALGYRLRRDGFEALPRALQRLRQRVQHEVHRSHRRSGRGRVDMERSIASSAGIVLF
jgi:RNA-directed DNA polymerase